MRKLITILLLFVGVIANGQMFNYYHQRSSGGGGGGGGEMITDGDFSAATFWNTTGSWSVSNDSARFADVSSGYLSQSAGDMQSAVQTSTSYTLTFTLILPDAGGGSFRITNSVDAVTYVVAADYNIPTYNVGDNAISIPFTTPSDIGVGGIGIRATSSGVSDFIIDDISLTAD